MNLTNLRTIVRDLTKTQLSTADGGTVSGGDTNFTDATINQYLTNAAHMVAQEVATSNDDWDFSGDIATANLILNQREYKFPTDILKIKRIEAQFDGVNWVRLYPINETEVSDPLGNETFITNRFDNLNNCYFATLEKSFYIYSGSIINVTSGLKVWYTKEVVGKDVNSVDLTAFATTTDTPNLSLAFQELLCYYACQKFYEGIGVVDRAQQMEGQFEKAVARAKVHYAQRIEPRGLRLKGSSDIGQFE